MAAVEDDEQEPGHLVGADHTDVDTGVISRIVEAARGVTATGEASAGGGAQPLQAALRDATPDERSTAVKELADDPVAYQAVHEALRAAGIEPP